MNQDLQTILDVFADTTGLPRFDPDASLPHALLIDQKWIVNLTEEDGRFVLFASPGFASAIPAGKADGGMLWYALSAGDSGNGDSGNGESGNGERGCSMRVGLHAASRQVILHAAADAGILQAIGLRSWLQDFFGQLEIWADMLSPDPGGAPVPATNDAAMPATHQLASRDWLRG